MKSVFFTQNFLLSGCIFPSEAAAPIDEYQADYAVTGSTWEPRKRDTSSKD